MLAFCWRFFRRCVFACNSSLMQSTANTVNVRTHTHTLHLWHHSRFIWLGALSPRVARGIMRLTRCAELPFRDGGGVRCVGACSGICLPLIRSSLMRKHIHNATHPFCFFSFFAATSKLWCVKMENCRGISGDFQLCYVFEMWLF